MDENLDWTTGQKSCWGVTARVLFGFGTCMTIAYMAGLVGTGHAEIVAAVAN